VAFCDHVIYKQHWFLYSSEEQWRTLFLKLDCVRPREAQSSRKLVGLCEPETHASRLEGAEMYHSPSEVVKDRWEDRYPYCKYLRKTRTLDTVYRVNTVCMVLNGLLLLLLRDSRYCVPVYYNVSILCVYSYCNIAYRCNSLFHVANNFTACQHYLLLFPHTYHLVNYMRDQWDTLDPPIRWMSQVVVGSSGCWQHCVVA